MKSTANISGSIVSRKGQAGLRVDVVVADIGQNNDGQC